MMRILLKNQSGAALVIALIMLIVLTLIGLASTFTSTFEMKLSGNKRGSTNAFYAADSGIQVVMAKITNFNMPGKYDNNKYNPFAETNPSSPDYNPNPTNASLTISFDPSQQGAPRGTGLSATSFEFNHYLLESIGRDQIEVSLIRSKCDLEQKVVRLIPTLQGGY